MASPSSSLPVSDLATLNVRPYLPVKLNSSNYLIWRTQFVPLLEGHDLLGFVDGMIPRPDGSSDVHCSDGSISSSTSVFTTDTWDRQDQLILGWIVSSLSESSLPHVVSARTSKEAWETLANVYAPATRSRMLDLKDKLFHIQQGSSSISEYLRDIRTIAYALDAINNPVPDEDLILATLRGLGDDFRDFSNSIRVRADSLTFGTLSGLLFTHEMRVRSSASASASSIITANVANYRGSRRRGGNFRGDRNGRQNYRGRPGNFVSSSGNNRNGALGQNFNSGPTNNYGTTGSTPSFLNEPSILCQICNQEGHSAVICPQRFNHSY